MTNHLSFPLGAVAAMLALPAGATTLPFPPARTEICTTASIVDKEKLADYLIRKYPISVLAVPADIDVRSRKSLLAVLLASGKTCEQGCGPDDRANLNAIDGHMSQLMTGAAEPAFHPTQAVDAAAYFNAPNEEMAITCGTVNGAPVAPVPVRARPAPDISAHWRLRGDPSELNVDRGDDGFGDTSKASISLARDVEAGSRSSQVIGYIGYAYDRTPEGWTDGSTFELIPYAGLERRTVRVKGSFAEDKSADTANLGLMGSLYYVTRDAQANAFGHWFNFRPDYLIDDLAGSRLLTANFEYQPVKNYSTDAAVGRYALNSFIILGNGNFASLKPILAVRGSLSNYTRRSPGAAPGEQKDAAHLGVHLGLSLQSDNASVPLDFKVTYTGLPALKGDVNVNFWNGALTWNFDSRKYFGLSLLYSHGTREDNFTKERKLEMALTARF